VDSDREVAERRLGELVGGKWRLERLLGTGGMAAVYAGRSDDGTTAAVKMLHPEMTLKRDVRERFVREAYVSNRVQHPGAVKILEHGESEGEAYLVMELLEGEPLGECVRRRGGLPVDDLLGYLDQVLDVLASAHEQGIIHRDIKPDNLFVGNDGRVKVLDFGLARMLDDVPGEFKTRTGLALGTMPYMAPEQALGKREQLDGRVDLFALGASAFRILAKRRVHEANSEAELLVAMATKPAPSLASVAPDVPRNVSAVVDLSLAFAKEARYPDARTMQTDVRAVMAGQDPPYAFGRMGPERDMPTRVDRAAPVVAPVAEPAPPSSVASLPSVPHVIAAGARAASTALMPVATALPSDPTRPEARGAAPGASYDSLPASQSPASLAQPPPSTALAPTGQIAPVHAATSRPPPPAKSALPVLLVLGGATILVLAGLVVVGLLLGKGVFGSSEATSAEPPATASQSAADASDPGAPAAAEVEPPSGASDDTPGAAKQPAPPSVAHGSSTAGSVRTAPTSTHRPGSSKSKGKSKGK
jgi:eukaryotic-like serine/threonine-protein kinase